MASVIPGYVPSSLLQAAVYTASARTAALCGASPDEAEAAIKDAQNVAAQAAERYAQHRAVHIPLRTNQSSQASMLLQTYVEASSSGCHVLPEHFDIATALGDEDASPRCSDLELSPRWSRRWSDFETSMNVDGTEVVAASDLLGPFRVPSSASTKVVLSPVLVSPFGESGKSLDSTVSTHAEATDGETEFNISESNEESSHGGNDSARIGADQTSAELDLTPQGSLDSPSSADVCADISQNHAAASKCEAPSLPMLTGSQKVGLHCEASLLDAISADNSVDALRHDLQDCSWFKALPMFLKPMTLKVFDTGMLAIQETDGSVNAAKFDQLFGNMRDLLQIPLRAAHPSSYETHLESFDSFSSRARSRVAQ